MGQSTRSRQPNETSSGHQAKKRTMFVVRLARDARRSALARGTTVQPVAVSSTVPMRSDRSDSDARGRRRCLDVAPSCSVRAGVTSVELSARGAALDSWIEWSVTRTRNSVCHQRREWSGAIASFRFAKMSRPTRSPSSALAFRCATPSSIGSDASPNPPRVRTRRAALRSLWGVGPPRRGSPAAKPSEVRRESSACA